MLTQGEGVDDNGVVVSRERHIHRKERVRVAAKSVFKAYQTYRSLDTVSPRKEVAKCFFKKSAQKGSRRL